MALIAHLRLIIRLKLVVALALAREIVLVELVFRADRMLMAAMRIASHARSCHWFAPLSRSSCRVFLFGWSKPFP